MAKLRVVVRKKDKLTVEVVNRTEIIAARQERAKAEAKAVEKATGKKPPLDLAPFAVGTPSTVEFSIDAAYAHLKQEKGSTDDILTVLAKEIARKIANEYKPEDVEVELQDK